MRVRSEEEKWCSITPLNSLRMVSVRKKSPNMPYCAIGKAVSFLVARHLEPEARLTAITSKEAVY